MKGRNTMKFSKRTIKQIIEEEAAIMLREIHGPDLGPGPGPEPEPGTARMRTGSPIGLGEIDPTDPLADSLRKIQQVIMAHQTQFSGHERVQFLTHIKTLVEAFIEADLGVESTFNRRLGQADMEAEKINRRNEP
jgi:hypothetical protein